MPNSPQSNFTFHELAAGPIRLKFQDGELRYLRVGGREIVRRIYFAVRDMIYDTILPEFTELEIKRCEDSFTIYLEAVCKNAEVDYRWSGEIIGTADGTITFKVTGKACSAFASPRIGLCVLFGTPALAGQGYEVSGVKGSSTGVFPTEVSPSILEAQLNTLRYTTPDAMTVTLDITGDGCGLEDQRNYGDTSYKAYHSLQHAKGVALPVGEERGDTLTLSVRNVPQIEIAPTPLSVTIGDIAGTLQLPALTSSTVAGSGDWFVKINSKRDNYRAAKTVTWGYNPAAHLFDDDTFTENLPAIIDQVKAARAFLPADAVIRIEPLSLDAPYPRPGREPRNRTQFGAAWLAAAMAYISQTGIDEVVTNINPGPADQLAHEFASYAGCPVLAVTTATAPIAAFGVKKDHISIVWVINVSNEEQECLIHDLSRCEATGTEGNAGFPQLITLAPYEVCRLTKVE